MIFDSHAHYYSSAFDKDREELLLRMHTEQDVAAVVCPAENIDSSVSCMELAGKYGAAAEFRKDYSGNWRVALLTPDLKN